MADRSLLLLCRRCGGHIEVQIPHLSPPTQNPVARWWRRRTLRIHLYHTTYELGKAVEIAHCVHYIAICPRGIEYEAEDGT